MHNMKMILIQAGLNLTSDDLLSHIRSNKVMFDQSALTDYYPYQGQIPKFRCSKGYLYIYYKTTCFVLGHEPGYVRTCADIWFTARRILNIFYLWYWIKIKRFFKGEPLPSSSSSTRHTDRRLLSRIWPTVEGFLEIFLLRTFIGHLSDVSESLTRYFIRKEAERNFIFNQVVNHQRVFHRNP